MAYLAITLSIDLHIPTTIKHYKCCVNIRCVSKTFRHR